MSSNDEALVISYRRRAALAPVEMISALRRGEGSLPTDLGSTLVPADMETVNRSVCDWAKGCTHHASESFLTSSVPQLEPNLCVIDDDLLCYEEGTAGRGGVLGVELVLSVTLEKTGLSYTCRHQYCSGNDKGDK